MDVFEKLNRKFGAWYEGLFGASADSDLRPRDILRRLLAVMEDNRREGLDGAVYVPNVYFLDIAVVDDEERHYLRTFLDADELSTALRRYLQQHGYRTRGGLRFEISEVDALAVDDGGERVRVRSRFDASVPERAEADPDVPSPEDVDDSPHPSPARPHRNMEDYAADSEPGTVPAVSLASLVVRMPDGAQEVFPLTARGVQIGRSRQSGNDIVIPSDTMISKRHARIEHGPEGFKLIDLFSTNGTYLNGEPLEAPRVLQPDDQIGLGESVLLFRAGARGGGARTSPRPEAPMAAAPRLVSRSGERYLLASQMSVGRSATSDIELADESVSAQHARIALREDRVVVEDLGSASGTRVNGETIPRNYPVVLHDGDEVAFGQVVLRLERKRTQ